MIRYVFFGNIKMVPVEFAVSLSFLPLTTFFKMKRLNVLMQFKQKAVGNHI